MDILIKNGTLINCEGGYKGDILIKDGYITKIGTGLFVEDCPVIDAEQKLILPGGVDVHTHMDLDLGNFRAVDDFYTGTVAAAFGGTTTIVDHLAFGPKDCSLSYMIDRYHLLAKDKSVIDYGFHGVFQHVNSSTLDEMDNLINQGITSFKIYMTYQNMLCDEDVLKVLQMAKKTGAVIAVHGENDGTINFLKQSFLDSGKKEPVFHALSRPDSTEAEAVNRMIYLSEMADYPNLYFVHISSKKALDEIVAARNRGAKNIYCETCPQYLILTDEKYMEQNYGGLKYIMSPPLRKQEDIDALWRGIENNDIDIIATDHCPFLLEQKLKGKGDFTGAPGGVSGVEERMEVVLTEGSKRGIPIYLLIDKLCTNPAKAYGLYPRKGSIRIGSEGDVAILSKTSKTITNKNLHGASDYTVYEGYNSDYTVETVIQRGRVIVDKTKLFADPGDGVFLERTKACIH